MLGLAAAPGSGNCHHATMLHCRVTPVLPPGQLAWGSCMTNQSRTRERRGGTAKAGAAVERTVLDPPGVSSAAHLLTCRDTPGKCWRSPGLEEQRKGLYFQGLSCLTTWHWCAQNLLLLDMYVIYYVPIASSFGIHLEEGYFRFGPRNKITVVPINLL